MRITVSLALGSLLAAPAARELDREARWLGGVLGHRLLRLTRIQYLTEAERRVRRDRMLLDRVQDPIVLTDPEGRMMGLWKSANR